MTESVITAAQLDEQIEQVRAKKYELNRERDRVEKSIKENRARLEALVSLKKSLTAGS